MKKLILPLMISLLGFALCPGQAQAQTVSLPPGKLAVFKAGDSSGTFNLSFARVQPCFVTVYDNTNLNQSSPLVTVALPTNAPNGIWINDHAGSEGGGISRSANRQYLALEGYTGNILSPTAAKPSSDPTVSRGFGIMDAFGNEQVLYSDLASWFGLPPGVTQNNPTGIATTDGTNFWGSGNVTGTSSEASGILFYNQSVSSQPEELENYIQAAAEARIINGTLYVVVPGGGVYNFLDPFNNDAVVPLPFDPNVSNVVQHVVLTNLFINWGTTFKNIANFDMNPAGTIAYGADQTYGIVKFTNNNGLWTQAPYYFNSTNLGTAKQKTTTQGCFGICVDFSGTNPVIYATTMETGTAPVNNAQGNANQNRLIRIVDTGVNPGTNVVAQTLATAGSTNETFRGLDFTPDLRPLITSVPANYSTTNGGSASFAVAADSVYSASYLWLQNGIALPSQTSPVLALNNLTTSFNGNSYQCVVSNQYGVVTSVPPAILTVTLTAQAPAITNTVSYVSQFVGGVTTFAAINPVGTANFTFQWYHGGSLLTDDGVKYSGSTSAALSISNLSTGDSGNYYIVVNNAGGTASNLVDVLTVSYHSPAFVTGLPASATTFVNYSTTLTATQSGGSTPVTYQWYKGATPLSDTAEFSGSQTTAFTINPASLTDAGSYYVVANNPAGSVTSAVASVTVLIPPPLSAVNYSNQTYLQTFDSLPDPGSNSVNSINNPKDAGSINGISYSLANPFDFTYPIITSGYIGGLGLSNTMAGWYGAADTLYTGVDGITRFGAQDGDQTTGGVIDFGLNDNGTALGTNRALGLLSTGTTGTTTYALKLINQSGGALNYISLGFIGELWRNGTGNRTVSFGYTIDGTATNFTLSAQSISNATVVPGLAFSFPTATAAVAVDGTQAINQVSLGATNLALNTPWPSGGALWLIWAIDYYGSGGGNGYAIDNLNFKSSATAVTMGTPPTLTGAKFTPGVGIGFSFTNTPGASFTVYAATNLTRPINWFAIGSPTETTMGSYSKYSYTDAQALTNAQRFYKVTSP